MKRALCMLLAVLLLSSLFGCHYGEGGDILEPVEFFYPRAPENFVYGAEDGVIASEMREASGHIGDLNYLLSMYLRGPQDENLRSPFPSGCRLESVLCQDETLFLALSSEFAALESVELTLACASLTKTCLALTDAKMITISAVAGGKSIHLTLGADSLLMSDYSAFEAQPVTE